MPLSLSTCSETIHSCNRISHFWKKSAMVVVFTFMEFLFYLKINKFGFDLLVIFEFKLKFFFYLYYLWKYIFLAYFINQIHYILSVICYMYKHVSLFLFIHLSLNKKSLQSNKFSRSQYYYFIKVFPYFGEAQC